MGQNGSGKTTIFKMILGELTPQKGKINIVQGNTIAVARQVIPREQLNLTINEFFQTAFAEKDYQLDKKIDEIPLYESIKIKQGKIKPTLMINIEYIHNPIYDELAQE